MRRRGAWIVATFGIVVFVMSPHRVLGWGTRPTAAPRPLLQQAAFGSCTPGARWGVVDRRAGEAVLQLVNRVRFGLGLPVLVANPALDASAVWKSLHMGRFGYFDHADRAPPIARTPFERALACGYENSYIGEDIAAGETTPEQAVRDWLNSTAHRQLIESAQYSEAGVGVAQSPQGRVYWTLDLGRGNQ